MTKQEVTFTNSYNYLNPYEYLKVFSSPDWYLKLKPLLQEYFYDYKGGEEKAHKSDDWLGFRNEFVLLVSELLDKDLIALAQSGPNMDEEREPIEIIVIHHSSRPPNTPLQIINALGLIRLYAPVFSRSYSDVYGQPIWSNHFCNGKPTFIAYHYLIENNGTVRHVLKDNQIGWHAGDWEVNKKSIAICFLDELDEKVPTKAALNSAREIIRKYKNVKVLGHREVNPKTRCPGDKFLGVKE